MVLALVGIAAAFVVGAIRAADLWRLGGRVEVVNVAVVSAFARKQGDQLPALLRQSGPSVYLGIATTIAESTLRFLATHTDSGPSRRHALREFVERDTRSALIVATRQLRQRSWLDTVALISIGYSGVQVAVYGGASMMLALGMIGATLLWLSNSWAARHLGRRFAVGATVLIESLGRTLL